MESKGQVIKDLDYCPYEFVSHHVFNCLGAVEILYLIFVQPIINN